MSRCPNCGVDVENGAKFCGECGAPIPQTKECPQCHAQWPAKAKFCGDCGYSFATGKMSAAGAALLGSGNTIAGDVVNNVSISNSGNVSNVVTNNIASTVVNNAAQASSTTERDGKSLVSKEGDVECTIELAGTVLNIGRVRFASLPEICKMTLAKRREYRNPDACQEHFYAYGAGGGGFTLNAKWIEHGVQKECVAILSENGKGGPKVIKTGEVFNDLADGECGLYVSRDVGLKLCATIKLTGGFRPELLYFECGELCLYDDLLFITKLKYDGVDVPFFWKARADVDVRKCGSLIDSWVEYENHECAYNIYSDEECRLMKLRIDSTFLSIGYERGYSDEDLQELIDTIDDDGVPEHLADVSQYSEHADFVQCEGAKMVIEDGVTGELLANETLDPLFAVSEEDCDELTSEAETPIQYWEVGTIFQREKKVSHDDGRVTFFEASKGFVEGVFFCFGEFSLSNVSLFLCLTADFISRKLSDGDVKSYARTVLAEFNYITPSCGKCSSLIKAEEELSTYLAFMNNEDCLQRDADKADGKRWIRVEGMEKSFSVEL